ncbi:unnamed protein product [Polarella glacialis]|uniref:Sulfotransferase n=1 Tax=Polarella glacialis TaxID=89957 RepID=A0A813EFB2_POLGL|nr:unnamed protein product [Polarella glacialis]|mmetsp:Transcript_71292/g.115032  ORF Transcript_71292/g.115032 Transcript_71292/m.115032 type:complete len:367 (+) Transcript_71292:91-1191(+)
MACAGGNWCCHLLKVSVFLFLSVAVKLLDVWHFLIEQPPGCMHEPLPGNHSGIKVLVMGFAKSGTRSICHALNDIGIRAYHSEDFHFLPWWDFIHRLRTQGSEHAHRSMSEIAHLTHTSGDLSDQLMNSVSKCRMEAVALDGLEVLTLPLYKGSPGAKVILLSWRTYHQWSQSLSTFTQKLAVMCQFNIVTGSSLSVLPWAALLRPLDKLVGRPIERVIRDGGPAVTEVSGPMVWLYHQSLNHRRQYEAWMPPSTTVVPQSEKDYNHYLDMARSMVPKQQLLEWDPRTDNFEELCKFLDIEGPCPKSGKTPRAINTWIFERDFPIASNVGLVVRLFLHWVNWKLFGMVTSFVCQFIRRGKTFDKRD